MTRLIQALRLAATAGGILSIVAAFALPAHATDTVVVLDASPAMTAPIAGKAKIDLVKKALSSLLPSFGADAKVGFVTYSTAKKSSCSSVGTSVLPVDPTDTRLISAVAASAVAPKGSLAQSLSAAAALLPAGGNILVVSDGIQTCPADPCVVAAALKVAHPGLSIDVVGVDVHGKATTARLTCVAAKTGGSYAVAADSAQLVAALQKAIIPPVPPVPVARAVKLSATDGKGGAVLAQAFFTILPASGGTVPLVETATPSAPLLPGDYVAIAAAGTKIGSLSFTLKKDGPAEVVVPVAGDPPKAMVKPREATMAAGTQVLVDWSGPAAGSDLIRISNADGSRASEVYSAAPKDGAATALRVPGNAGNYQIEYFYGPAGAVLASAPLSVTPAKVTLAGADTAQSGLTYTVRWSGPAGDGDVIAFAKKGSAPSDYVVGSSVAAKTSPVDLPVPTDIGQYELRYITGGDKVVLGSRDVAVTAVVASVAVPALARGGWPLDVSWQGPNSKDDYVSIARQGADPAFYYARTWSYTGPNPVHIKAPVPPGSYEVRYVHLIGDKLTIVATKPLTVVPGAVLINAPATAAVGADVSLSYRGPEGEGDYVVISHPGDSDGDYLSYADVSGNGRVTLTMPKTPGAYEIRYLGEGDGFSVLGRTAIAVK